MEKDVDKIEQEGPPKKKIKTEIAEATPSRPDPAKDAYYSKFVKQFQKVHKRQFKDYKRTGESSFSEEE